MKKSPQPTPVAPGDVLTCLGTITMADADGKHHVNRVRGDVFTVTEAMFEASRNRHGHSYFEDLSEEAQVARWGKQLLAIGDHSATVRWYQGDDASTRLARDAARANAALIADPTERAAALEAVRKEFEGLLGDTVVLARYRGDDPYRIRDAR